MNLNSIDLNKLRVFHAVIQSGSYSAAGEELGLTRSAISQSMTTLETQLGALLFQRKGRRLYPTKEARELSEEFSRYQKGLDQVLKRVAGKDNTVEGTVRIGSYYEFAKTHLPIWIKDFQQLYPETQFRLVFDSPSRLQKHLENGRVDMNFSIFPSLNSREVEAQKIFSQELVLVAPKTWASKANSFESLLTLPHIEYYKNHQVLPRWIRTHFKADMQKRKPREIASQPPSIFAASAEMLLEFVAQKVGVGVAPLYLVNSSPLKGLTVVRPTSNQLTDYIWLNQFKGQFENSAHRSFYSFVKSRIVLSH